MTAPIRTGCFAGASAGVPVDAANTVTRQSTARTALIRPDPPELRALAERAETLVNRWTKLSSRPDHLTRGLEEDLSGEGREVFAHPLATNRPFAVDEKEGPLGYPSFHFWIVVAWCAGNLAVHNAVRFDDVQRVITEEWEGQLQRVRECLL